MTSSSLAYEYKELGKCIDLIIDHRGKTPRKLNSDWVEEGIPTISAKNVNSGKLVAQEQIRFVTYEVYKKWMKEDVRPGDCLLVSEGATLGEYLYWDNNFPIVLGQRIFCIRTNPEILYPRYFYAYMTSNEFQSEIVGRATGSSVPGLRQAEVLKLGVKLLPMKEQIFIGDLIYNLNKKIEKNSETNQTLEQIAQAIFKSWFVDFEPTRAKIAAKKRWLALNETVECSSPTCYAEEFDGANQTEKASEKTTLEDAMSQAAMAALSGKTIEELQELEVQGRTNAVGAGSAGTASTEYLEQLRTTADLFPDALVDSELGEVPTGWAVKNISHIVERLKPKKRYTKKQVEPYGLVPVFEQGADILLGYHNDDAGFKASPENPLFIFGDHTCITHLSCDNFDISQNVIPLTGKDYPTVWAYYAIQGKQEFQEYRRHWSELIIKDVVTPGIDVAEEYAKIATSLYRHKDQMVREIKILEQTRDSLLPKLLSGELELDRVGA